MALPFLAWQKEGLGESEEALGGVWQLELCEGIPSLEDQQKIRHGSPIQGKNPKYNPNACQSVHALPHQKKESVGLGVKAPLHAPHVARGGNTPRPYLERIGTGVRGVGPGPCRIFKDKLTTGRL